MKVDAPIVGDCAEVLGDLFAELGQPGVLSISAPWWERIDRWRAEKCLAFQPDCDIILPPPQHLMHEVHCALQGQDAIVSTDVGQHQCGLPSIFQPGGPSTGGPCIS